MHDKLVILEPQESGDDDDDPEDGYQDADQEESSQSCDESDIMDNKRTDSKEHVSANTTLADGHDSPVGLLASTTASSPSSEIISVEEEGAASVAANTEATPVSSSSSALLLEEYPDLPLHVRLANKKAHPVLRSLLRSFIGEKLDVPGITGFFENCLLDDAEIRAWEMIMKDDTLLSASQKEERLNLSV